MKTFLPRIGQNGAPAQRGMVLLLCLLFLVALSLLGLSASTETLLQNKLSANLQDAERARQAALLASSWAERWLLSLEGPAPENCTVACDGLILHVAGELPAHPESKNFDWWMANGHEAGVDPLTGERLQTLSRESADAPAWIIESVKTIIPAESGDPDLQTWYRIVARGTGRAETAVSVVESIVVRSWPVPVDNAAFSVAAGACPGSTPTVICGRYAWREIL